VVPFALRLVVAALSALCCLVTAPAASAWVSITVKADKATVHVDPDGGALVSHDILLRLRGGPLEKLRFAGVDADAVAQGQATLTRAKSGKAAGPPVLMAHEYQDGEVQFKVSKKQGIRSGSYLLRFEYRTDLRARGGLRAKADLAEVAWTGLVFDDGIDSLQTTFVLPRGELPPRLPDADPSQNVGLVTRSDGVYLSELQRGSEVDRLALTRPHVPKRQQVQWLIHADRSVFRGLDEPASQFQVEEVVPLELPPSVKVRQRSAGLRWGLVAGLALVFSLLVNLKQRTANTSFLIPLRNWVRQLLLLCAMATSLAFALVYESASLAGAALIVAMLVALQRPVRTPIEPKGPGKWRPVEFDDVAVPAQAGTSRRSWLDASSGMGLLLFTLAIAGFAVFGLRLLGQAPYHSAMVLVYSTTLVPLFFTLGTPNAKPLVEEQREFLSKLRRRLRRHKGIDCSLQGRFALDTEVPDDLRLRIGLESARQGLVSLDVGVGFVDTTLRRLLVPALVVRVREDSPAHRALPREAHWSPGRAPEERVAVIRAPLPLLTSCVETLTDTVARLSEKGRGMAKRKGAQRANKNAQRRPSSSVKSAARGTATSKLGSASVPSHVTR